jgi:DHA1 family purine ribonucleoside efflux pump-like MFS transporter
MSGAIAMRLVPESLLPRAMSIILTGVSVATVCAAPVGAYVGDLWGWRATFLIAAVIGAITLLVQLVTMPRLPASGASGIRALAETAANPMIRLGLVAILLVVSGHFAAFTYMRAFLEQVTMLDIEKVSLVLLAFGIAGFFGNLAGGAIAGRSLKAAMSLAPLLMAIAAAVLFLGGASPVVAAIGVTLWGFAFGALPVSVQTWMISAAPDQAESAGGLMVTAFQVAIATGAVLGGLLVDNWSVASPVAYFVLAAFAVAVIMTARAPRRMA